MIDKNNKFPVLTIEYTNDLELIELILTIYSVGKFINLRGFEKTVLKYYIKYGYSDEAKQYIKEDELKTDQDIRTADVNLRKKGFLLLGKTNFRKSTLSDEMETLRKCFIEKSGNFYPIVFKNV